MSLTPNYSFIIPTGSDAVNLLTQCYPNFTSLDSILKPIQESGVTVATDTKVGTVHQLVRTDSSCNMFRFIATGNYVLGDTFTVDGTPVTATAMNGTSLPDGSFVINQSVICVLNNLVLTVMIAGKETTSLPASAITYDNTVSGLTATNAQDAIDEIAGSAPTEASFFNDVFAMTSTVIVPTPASNFILATAETHFSVNASKTLMRMSGYTTFGATSVTTGYQKICEFATTIGSIPTAVDYYGIIVQQSISGVVQPVPVDSYLRITTSGNIEIYGKLVAGADWIYVTLPCSLYYIKNM